jgi:hypothetical protein
MRIVERIKSLTVQFSVTEKPHISWHNWKNIYNIYKRQRKGHELYKPL